MGTARRKRLPGPGERAPDFHLRALQGGSRKLEDALARGPLLLAFFKITCPVCQLEFPFLERIHREAPPGSLTVCGVSQDDEEWTRDFNRSYGITFPTLLDGAAEQYPASNAFGISIVPTAFLVERDGTISWALEGFDRRQIQGLAGKFGVDPFRPGEFVPESKAG